MYPRIPWVRGHTSFGICGAHFVNHWSTLMGVICYDFNAWNNSSFFHGTGLMLVPWIQAQNTCKTLSRDGQSPSAEKRRTTLKFVLLSDNSWKHCSYEIRSSQSGDGEKTSLKYYTKLTGKLLLTFWRSLFPFVLGFEVNIRKLLDHRNPNTRIWHSEDRVLWYIFNKSQRDALFLKFILIKNSTFFGHIYCPSSGVSTPYTQQ